MPTIMIIPSGIGCSVGGFAGDAMPAARLLASASGCLITHPNVMNGASLYWNDSRIQYVEGYSLDRFAAGELSLRPVRSQQIGIILDSGIEEESRIRHIQVADACRASLGLNIGPFVTTDKPLNVTLSQLSSGSSWGELGEPDSLLRAGEKLRDSGATSIAVVTNFPDDLNAGSSNEYRLGKGVDCLAGAEAVISHLLVRNLCLPCAHAPAVTELPLEPFLDPRVAGEEIGHTFLTCVLVGLSRAPDLVPISKDQQKFDNFYYQGLLRTEHVGAVVAPKGALGGEAVLACLERGVVLVEVFNPSVLNISSFDLGLTADIQGKDAVKILSAKNYIEAAGLIMLLREGINPEAFKRPITSMKELS